MKHRLMILLAVAIVMAFAPFGIAVASPATTFPVSGTGTTAAGVAVNFAGTFDIQKFEGKNGQLVAIGTLSGIVTDAVTGAELGEVSALKTTIPVISGGGQAASASQDVGVAQTCDILYLELGPLDLDLLGLVVHLDQIVLDIDAEGGSGNLLGNLLCAIVGLFDAQGPANILADLLNSLLDLLDLFG
jgi:hypothetical protein